jgi:hypothetical protein
MLGEQGLSTSQQLQQALSYLQTSSVDLSRKDENWQEAQYAAQKLAMLYWHVHQTALHPVQARKTPPIPYVLDKTVLVTGALPVQAALAAFSNAQSGAQQWEAATRPYPTFTYKKDEGTTDVQIRPDDLNAVVDERTVESLWEQVQQLSDLDGDVLLAMLAQVLATDSDERGGTWIKGTQILNYRGIKPKTHAEKNGRKRPAGHRQEDVRDIAACISHLGNTWVTVRQWITQGDEQVTDSVGLNTSPEKKRRKNKQPQQQLFAQESRLVNVMDTIYQYDLQNYSPSMRIDKHALRPPVAIAWRYQLGSWIEPFLKEPNRKFAWLLQKALGYDPYHKTWEKRLDRYFIFHMRMNGAGGGTTIVRRIGEVIEELSLKVDRRNPEKTKQRFETAMNRLLADEQIDGWTYLQDTSLLPSREWINTWLNYTFQVTVDPIKPLELSGHNDGENDPLLLLELPHKAPD